MIREIFPLTGNKKREILPVSLKLFLVLVSFFILPLVTCPLWGQVVQKKQLTESDYKLWGEMHFEKTAPNGSWVSYKMQYDSAMDTTFVRQTATEKTYCFPGGKKTSFIGNNHFICRDNKQLQVLDLITGKRDFYPNDTQFAYSEKTNQLLLLAKKERLLKIINLDNNTQQTIQRITAFALSPSQKEILLCRAENDKFSIGIIGLTRKTEVKWILKNSVGNFDAMTWQEEGKAAAFLSMPESDSKGFSLYFYNLEKQNLSKLNSQTQPGFPADKVWDKNMTYPITISPDLQRVFFGLSPKEMLSHKTAGDTVEVWNGNDKWIYPLEQRLGHFEESAVLAVWHPDTKKIIQITSPQLPKVMLTGSRDYAIVSNPKEYEPQFEIEAPRDFYIVNLDTGEKEIFLEKQNEFHLYILPSPSGKYVAYFKENNWWIYDIKLKKHTNITQKIGVPFFGRVYILAGDSAYGTAGWSSNDKEILLYDQYDIWAVKPDGTSFRKLTQGREKRIKFRINILMDYDLFVQNYDGFKSININLNDQQILSAEGHDEKTGFYSWRENTGLRQIVYSDLYLDKIHSIKEGRLYIYREQGFDFPPRLVLKNNLMERTIFQSNPHYRKYEWGSSELIKYYTSKAKELSGVLYYPSNYNPDKKYPMIVYIYEKQSQRLHRYSNPSLYEGSGFNPAVLTSRGYFVLCPDIEHEDGTVGEDAVDCTISATQNIIARNLVDPKKIGLMGHSFGGYETNFIITQTNLFAAAISGASISDINSFYFTVGWDLSISDMTRFNTQQWRMIQTPFENPELYTQNSPIANSANIKTPLLLWTGKEDWHVSWHQSIEFYMALRRLGKPVQMLLYPEEKHVLTKQKNQKDLSFRISQWFDYYLKNDVSSDWITKTIN
jgi:dipeptidyl aminopeptidase/acylaminoacyl peptidase